MGIFKGLDILDLAEAYAEENDSIFISEDAVSEYFDEYVAPMVLETYGPDDTTAFNEEFNNWSDALCKDGDLHAEQYNEYCYVGKYSS